jgi:hypothetical protein
VPKDCLEQATPIELDVQSTAVFSGQETACHKVEAPRGTGTLTFNAMCDTSSPDGSSAFVVILANGSGERLPPELQDQTPTCNYSNYNLIGESTIGTYYLEIRPTRDGGKYTILVETTTQDEDGPLDVGDQFGSATSVGRGIHEGQVGQLDGADYYAFNAESDTSVELVAHQDSSFTLHLFDESAQLVCALEIPERAQAEFTFRGAELEGCSSGLESGAYVLGILQGLDGGGAYELVIK